MEESEETSGMTLAPSAEEIHEIMESVANGWELTQGELAMLYLYARKMEKKLAGRS